MSAQHPDSAEVLGEASISLVEIVSYTHIDRAAVEMVEVGLLEPQGASIEQWHFAARDLSRLRAAQRLVEDLGVNVSGAAVILDLLEERDTLLKQLAVVSR